MSDILKDAALEYEKLRNIIYRIVIGRKGSSYSIMLHFPPEPFFHLAGLQHLTDLKFPSTNKERIYKEIMKGNLTESDIKKSVFYKKWFVEERLLGFSFLEEMIDSNSVTYLINARRYASHTRIKADYLCERKIDSEVLYLFLVMERHRPKFENECTGCSFFRKHEHDYTNGASKTKTLLIEKRKEGGSKIIYRNPTYVE